MQRIRASAVCVDEGALLCVRLRDPISGNARLFVPGGAVEVGETPAQAATRETREETGYLVAVDPRSQHVVRYPFTWAGLEVDCTTHFFRAALVSPSGAAGPVHPDSIHEGVEWLPLAQLERELGFHAAILQAVQALVSWPRDGGRC